MCTVREAQLLKRFQSKGPMSRGVWWATQGNEELDTTEVTQQQQLSCIQLHELEPARFLCLWNSPGKNTGVGCHFLLQGVKVKSESEVAQSCPTLRDPMDGSPPGSSIRGIFQARVLEWVAIAFSDNVLGLLKFFNKQLSKDK